MTVPAAWRVAITRSDESASGAGDLDAPNLIAVPVPVLVEGPPPDPARLASIARHLQDYDWVICSSVRGVRALMEARASGWPAGVRAAAVGPVTAAALAAAGAVDPVHADRYNAQALWEKLRPLDAWQGRRVLVATVGGGRRDIIDGLTMEGVMVTEVEAYAMTPRPARSIQEDWHRAHPDAVILGSGAAARQLVAAIGADAVRGLKAVIAIGPTTASALSAAGIPAIMPPRATFAAAVAHLASLKQGGVTT